MKLIFYYFQYAFLRILFIFLKILPLSISKKILSLIFRSLGKFTNAHKTAINNCETVFPNFSKNKIENIIDKSWNNLGETICELLKINELFDNKKILFKGLDNISDFKNNKSQAIFISIHQSNWEILVPMLDRLSIKIGGVYRHINNFFLDKFILKLRKKTLKSNTNFYTPKGKKSARDLIDALKKNFSIVLLVDQKDTAGENVIFFNKNVKTQIGFLKIARKFNIPIVPIKNTRLEDGKIELIFSEPIYHDNQNIDDKKRMEQIHRIIEGWIVSNPSQWFWQHKRFN